MEEEGSSSRINDGYIPSFASSSGIEKKTIPKLDRTILGWMTTSNDEMNIPQDNEEMKKIKILQNKSSTHRINIQRTNWLYYWSGGFDIFLLQNFHLQKVENYVKKMELFRKKFLTCEEKMEEENLTRNYDDNWIYDELKMNKCEKLDNQINNYKTTDEMDENDKMDEEVNNNDNNNDNNDNNKNNDNNNDNNDENNTEKKDYNKGKEREEKLQMEKELLKEMTNIKELEIEINELREKFTGRMKFLHSIWDDTTFFSPFETIDSSSLRLTHCNQDRCYIIRLSSTVCGNITITKRTTESVLHRRLPIVGERIYDAEYLSVIRNQNSTGSASGYYNSNSPILNYLQKF